MNTKEEKSMLQEIADTLIAAGTRTEKQIQRKRLEAEWRTKKTATKQQTEPVGLFAQQQEELF